MIDDTLFLANLRDEWIAAADDDERKTVIESTKTRLKPLAANPDLATMARAMEEPDDAKAWSILSPILDMAEEATPPAVSRDWTAPGKPTSWLVDGWLPAGRVALLSGEGGRGKSKLAIMLAAGIAGEPHDPEWLAGGPDATRHGPVVFATWEDSRDDIRLRLCDWPAAQTGNRSDTLPALLGDRLTVMDCARSGPAWAPGPDGSRHTSTMGELTATGAAIRTEAEERKAQLLVLDPLAAAFACNENDRGIVRAFMSDWDGWARAISCTVLLIAHPPKSGADYSGSTDWHAASRAVWTLGLEKYSNGNESEGTMLECIKSSYGKKPAPLELTNWKWWKASPWPAAQASNNRKRDTKTGSETDGPPYPPGFIA